MKEAIIELHDYKNGMNDGPLLFQICITHGKKLVIGNLKPEVKGEEFLYALSGTESNFGRFDIARYEKSYDRNGVYGGKNALLNKSLNDYGALAACSYGPWQIMYATAVNLGFAGHPLELWAAERCIPYVVRYINRSIERGAASIDDLLDSYNTGSHTIGRPPKEYIDRFWRCLAASKRKWV